VSTTIVAVAELSKRYPRYRALLLSLPIVSILAFILSWFQHQDLPVISRLANEALVVVPLGLVTNPTLPGGTTVIAAHRVNPSSIKAGRERMKVIIPTPWEFRSRSVTSTVAIIAVTTSARALDIVVVASRTGTSGMAWPVVTIQVSAELVVRWGLAV
jgi:hypothetical protein